MIDHSVRMFSQICVKNSSRNITNRAAVSSSELPVCNTRFVKYVCRPPSGSVVGRLGSLAVTAPWTIGSRRWPSRVAVFDTVLWSSSKTTACWQFQCCLLRDAVHREPSSISIWLASIEVRIHYIQRCSIDIIFIQSNRKGMVILRAPLSDLCASLLSRHTALDM